LTRATAGRSAGSSSRPVAAAAAENSQMEFRPRNVPVAGENAARKARKPWAFFEARALDDLCEIDGPSSQLFAS
jgi:hypothetical protein